MKRLQAKRPGFGLETLAFVLMSVVLLCVLPKESTAQSTFSLPGLPDEALSEGAPDNSDPSANSADSASADSPTDALTDLLIDPEGRAALAEALRRVAEEVSAEQATTVSSDAAAQPADPSEDLTGVTFGARTVIATREVFLEVREDLLSLWIRMQRIPNTLELAGRAFDPDVMVLALRQLIVLAPVTYGVLIALRFALRPLRSHVARRAAGRGWFKILWLRLQATALDVLAIPIAVLVSLFLLLAFGWTHSDSLLTTLFLNAFVAMEIAVVICRFALSPRNPALRLTDLSETAIRSFWRLALFLIYYTGVTNMLLVPIASESISIFVGRAASAVFGALAVLVVIIVVILRRRDVEAWLAGRPENAPDQDEPVEAEIWTLRQSLASYWHVPVLLYLIVVFLVVLARPGNVLLPLLLTTAEILATIVGGLMLMSLLRRAEGRRVRLPRGLTRRLPLLELRINTLVPGILWLGRLAILATALAFVLNALGIIVLADVLSSGIGPGATDRIFAALLVLAVAILAWLLMASWVDYRLNPFVGTPPTPREITLLTLMRNALTIVLSVVTLMTVLSTLGINIGPLLASAGVLGLAISFGAQKLVEDIITGVFIQLENAMNVGDVVSVGGVTGTVERLTVRSVTLRDLQGVVHMIPFSSAAMISNYMRDFAYHVADMGVAYREDTAVVEQAMTEAFDELRADPEQAQNVIGDLEWFGLNTFGDSAIVMRARIKTVPGAQWGVGRAYNAILKRVFDARGIEIPFPHQTLYFGEDRRGHAPAVNVRMEGQGSAATSEGAT